MSKKAKRTSTAARGSHVLSSRGDKVFNAFIWVFVIFLVIVTLYPLIYVFSMAISDPVAVARKEIWMLPKGFSTYAFGKVFNDPNVPVYYFNTIWYTLVGIVFGIITTSLAAYPLSRRHFKARHPIMVFITFTMFFGGGLIPTYIVVARFLGLYGSRWAIILPSLTSAWYIIIARTFFSTIPEEMLESAKIDGAGEFMLFARFVFPLSAPILAVLALYFGIGHWNAYFNASLYLNDKALQPLSLYVRRVVIQNSLEVEKVTNLTYEQVMSTLQVKYAVIVVSVVPILCLYPALSKYLQKGMLVGSLKG